jgi:hypothetical protein
MMHSDFTPHVLVREGLDLISENLDLWLLAGLVIVLCR